MKLLERDYLQKMIGLIGTPDIKIITRLDVLVKAVYSPIYRVY